MRLSKSFPPKVVSFDFLPLIKKETCARMKTRLLALQLLKEGKTVEEICNSLKIARDRVRNWVSRFLDHGVVGLKERPGRGRKTKITGSQKIALSEFIIEKSISKEGGRLFGEDIINLISSSFDVNYSLSSAYNIMHELGFSWITSRSIHPKCDKVAQEEFKKNLV